MRNLGGSVVAYISTDFIGCAKSAHPINPVDISFITKTKKTLCDSVKGQRPLPLLDDGL
jgi:hypothetical protein